MTRAALGYQGIYSFSIEVRPSHYITLFMPMKCSAPYLTLPLESVVNLHQLAVPGWGVPWLLLGSSWLHQPLTHLSPTLTFVDGFHPCFERSVSHFSQG